jgi:hypothetical protein
MSHKRSADEAHNLYNRYTALLDQANAWVPPTDEHMNFKKFMIEQLTSSRSFDCDYWMQAKFHYPKYAEWLSNKIAHFERDEVYHTEEYKKECERVASRNAWVKALRESV